MTHAGLAPHPDEAFATETFRTLFGLSQPTKVRPLGARGVALDPAHVAALVELPAEQWEEKEHVRITADMLIRAAATLQLLYPSEDLYVSVHKQPEYPVLVRTKDGALAVMLAPRKSETAPAREDEEAA